MDKAFDYVKKKTITDGIIEGVCFYVSSSIPRRNGFGWETIEKKNKSELLTLSIV